MWVIFVSQQGGEMRHGILCQVVSGKSKDVPAEWLSEWQESLPSIISEYQPKDFFNAVETGLFYDLTPTGALAFKEGKQGLPYCISDVSEEMTPLVIEKSKIPRCPKKIQTLSRYMPAKMRELQQMVEKLKHTAEKMKIFADF